MVEASVHYFLQIFAHGWEVPNNTVYMSCRKLLRHLFHQGYIPLEIHNFDSETENCVGYATILNVIIKFKAFNFNKHFIPVFSPAIKILCV